MNCAVCNGRVYDFAKLCITCSDHLKDMLTQRYIPRDVLLGWVAPLSAISDIPIYSDIDTWSDKALTEWLVLHMFAVRRIAEAAELYDEVVHGVERNARAADHNPPIEVEKYHAAEPT